MLKLQNLIAHSSVCAALLRLGEVLSSDIFQYEVIKSLRAKDARRKLRRQCVIIYASDCILEITI